MRFSSGEVRRGALRRGLALLAAPRWFCAHGVSAEDDFPVPPEGEKGWHCSETVCCRTTPWWLDEWFMVNMPNGDSCLLEMQFWGYFTVAAIVFLFGSLICFLVYITRFWRCWDACRPCCLPCCAPPVQEEYLELGTTPLFGKIDNPLGSNINAPSAGWTRIVPDSVYSTPDGIGPLLPDYQAANHNPAAHIYDYNTWVASLAPDTASSIHRHKQLIHHDHEHEANGHIRHIANVLGHRMLPGFTGRVVPYAYQPSFDSSPAVLAVSQVPPSVGSDKPPTPPPQSPAQPNAPAEAPAAAPAAAKAPWWNPFAKKAAAQAAAAPIAAAVPEQPPKEGAADNAEMGQLHQRRTTSPPRRWMPAFGRRGGEQAEGGAEEPASNSPRRRLFGGLSRSLAKSGATAAPDNDTAEEQGAQGQQEQQEQQAQQALAAEPGGEPAANEEQPAAAGEEAGAAATEAAADGQGAQRGRFGFLGRKKNDPAAQGVSEVESPEKQKGLFGRKGLFGGKKAEDGGAEESAAAAEKAKEKEAKRRLNFSPPWKRKGKGEAEGDTPTPPELEGYKGREAELERAAVMGQSLYRRKAAQAEADRRRAQARSSSSVDKHVARMKAAQGGSSFSAGAKKAPAGAQPSAGQKADGKEDRKGKAAAVLEQAPAPLPVQGSSNSDSDSEAGAWDSASQPVQEFGLSAELEEAGDKPMPLPPAKGGLAPLGQPGGGLAPLGKPAPGGLAPLKPMGGSLAPLKPLSGPGGAATPQATTEEVRQSIQSLDSEDAF
eukprot:jgi/Tetstr1/456199/TSEL_042967.t1